jgi:glycosyltransferase involved in cell wall biosynthesis
MISVIIPTRNAEADLPITLAALVPATIDGLVRQVIVADGHSADRTAAIADATGADLVTASPATGALCAAGAIAARYPWLMFLEPGTSPRPGWEREVERHLAIGPSEAVTYLFTLRLDGAGFGPRWRETTLALRARFGAPAGAHGFIVSRNAYRNRHGHRSTDRTIADFCRRQGRSALRTLRAELLLPTRPFDAVGKPSVSTAGAAGATRTQAAN